MSGTTQLDLSRPDLLNGDAFVGGRWDAGASRFRVTNPADGTLVAEVADVGAAGTERAVAAAHAALPAWRERTGAERAAILRRWHRLILDNVGDLARILTAEQGKPLVEARGEVVYAANFIDWFADEARRVNGEVLTPHAPDKRLLVLRQPVGVVAAITPWNFPLAMITRKAGPALAVGCTMVVKPAELTPLSALALARLGEEAGLPEGVFSVVTGEAGPIGEVLTGDTRVRKFSFTGSTAVGRRLAARCMDTVKRVSLELGGNAPFIVFEDADLEAAVRGAIASKFRNAGQTCVCANRLLVHDAVHDRFAARLAEAVGKLRVGAGLLGDAEQGPLIDDRAVAKAGMHVADAITGGAKLLAGGRPVEGPGNFFAPTVLSDVRPDALLCREETFGPIAGLVRFSSEAEAIRLANDTEAGLAAYVFTRDAARQWRVMAGLDYGMVGINTGLISTEVAPFGGIKQSGFGREGSHHGIDDYLDMKMICLQVEALAEEAG